MIRRVSLRSSGPEYIDDPTSGCSASMFITRALRGQRLRSSHNLNVGATRLSDQRPLFTGEVRIWLQQPAIGHAQSCNLGLVPANNRQPVFVLNIVNIEETITRPANRNAGARSDSDGDCHITQFNRRLPEMARHYSIGPIACSPAAKMPLNQCVALTEGPRDSPCRVRRNVQISMASA